MDSGWELRYFWKSSSECNISHSGYIEHRTDIYLNTGNPDVGFKQRGGQADGCFERKACKNRSGAAELLQKDLVSIEGLRRHNKLSDDVSNDAVLTMVSPSPSTRFRMIKSRNKDFHGDHMVEWCYIHVDVTQDSGMSWKSCDNWISLCVEGANPSSLEDYFNVAVAQQQSLVTSLGSASVIGSYAAFVQALSVGLA